MNVKPRFGRFVRGAAVSTLCASFGLGASAAIAAGDTPPAALADTKAAPTLYPIHTAADNAKTVTVNVLVRGAMKDTLVDKERLQVAVGPSGTRIERQGLAAPAATKIPPVLGNPTLAVFNGKETLEYDADSHKYLRTAGAKDGSPFSHFIPVRSVWFAARGLSERSVETAKEETIDGRKMIVENADYTIKGDTHPILRDRYLIDAETHLLRRKESILWRDDKAYLFAQYDFSDWSINPELPEERLAWQPPADAKETALPKPLPAPPRPPLLAAGSPAPDFTCIGADDKPVKLSDLKGKIVILDFWATWCGPCQKSMPHLQKVYDQVKDQNVVVLALCVSDLRPAYDTWRVRHKSDYSFPIAYDPAGRDASKNISTALFKVTGIPTQYVIDKDGKVAASMVGFMGNADHRLEDELAKLGVVVPVKETAAN